MTSKSGGPEKTPAGPETASAEVSLSERLEHLLSLMKSNPESKYVQVMKNPIKTLVKEK